MYRDDGNSIDEISHIKPFVDDVKEDIVIKRNIET